MINSQYHWHEATCGHKDISGKEQHVFVDGFGTICGSNGVLLLSDDGKTIIDVGDKTITSVSIPDGITTIGDKQFWCFF